jgi:hypothetical protein
MLGALRLVRLGRKEMPRGSRTRPQGVFHAELNRADATG